MTRLPIDTVLLVIGAPDDGDSAAALLAAWREARMPVAHVRFAAGAATSPCPDEPVVVASGRSAFAGTDLDAWLEARGATTLALCGSDRDGAIATTLRDAVALGYRLFVTRESGAPDIADVAAAGAPALVHAAALARLIRDRHGR